jgi:hypothetical protein
MVVPSLRDCGTGKQREDAVGREALRRNQIRSARRGGECGRTDVTGSGSAWKAEVSSERSETSTGTGGANCSTSAETTAGGCCCVVQHTGTLGCDDAGFGQWLQEGRFACSVEVHIAVLKSSVSRQRTDTRLRRLFFISYALDVRSCEVGACNCNYL